jgi:hypothetical protein
MVQDVSAFSATRHGNGYGMSLLMIGLLAGALFAAGVALPAAGSAGAVAVLALTMTAGLGFVRIWSKHARLHGE